ncbi:MAG: radical SAM protein [Candidatus Omnitrophota bacterium]
MKIGLISPKGILSKNKKLVNFWNKSLETFSYRKSLTGFSSNLLIIASLTPQSYKLTFVDENFDQINFDEHYDLVAITCMTQQAKRAYEIGDFFRKKNIKVIIGGVHATLLPEEAKEHADSVVIGEAENIWSDILLDFNNNSLKTFYKSDRPVDLTKIPLPRYDLVNKENYSVVWIQTSRGCPIDCDFCSASKIFGLQIRHRKVEQIIEEIKLVKKIWRFPQISFADDNIFMDRKYAVQLVNALIPLKIRWFAQTDVSIAEDDNLLKKLKKSGCKILFIGFETINKKNVEGTDKTNFKYKRVLKYKEHIRKIQSYGIGIMGAFMVGFDNDDKTVFKKTSDFIVDNKLYAAQITILTPLPGTRLRDRLKNENRLLSKTWDNYTFLDVNFMPANMTPNELQKGLFEIYKKVYSKDSAIKRTQHFKNIYKNV